VIYSHSFETFIHVIHLNINVEYDSTHTTHILIKPQLSVKIQDFAVKKKKKHTL